MGKLTGHVSRDNRGWSLSLFIRYRLKRTKLKKMYNEIICDGQIAKKMKELEFIHITCRCADRKS